MTQGIRLTHTKTELISELETYGDIIVYPEDFTWKELEEKLRYHRCQNCISYENRKGCSSCAQELVYAHDDFYEV